MAAGYPANVDHLVYATPELASTVAWIEQQLGITCQAGGQHAGRGTRNAIVSLGEKMYLEIIGPDLFQDPPRAPRWFNIDALERPTLVAWAAKCTHLDDLVRNAAQNGINLGAVESGNRNLPDGTRLHWRFSDPTTVLADGIIPFFIDWSDSRHPADGEACKLTAFRAEHPNCEVVRQQLDVLEVDLEVTPATHPALIAILTGPSGELELK